MKHTDNIVYVALIDRYLVVKACGELFHQGLGISIEIKRLNPIPGDHDVINGQVFNIK